MVLITIATLLVGMGIFAIRDFAMLKPGGLPEVSNIRVVLLNKMTRLVVSVDHDLAASVRIIANPYRVVIDLPETAFLLKTTPNDVSRGVITALRYGRLGKDRSRIVADLKQPVKIANKTMIAPKGELSGKLVIDLEPVSQGQFIEHRGGKTALDSKIKPNYDRLGSTSMTKKTPITIVIDPGHGGIDSGALAANGLREKDLVLKIAKELRHMLEKQGRYQVVMTRDDDSFISLAQRVNIARKAHAKLFISIHADSFSDNTISGVIVHTLSKKASDKLTHQLVEKENTVDLLAGVEFASDDAQLDTILIDLARRETKDLSILAAKNVTTSLGSKIVASRNPIRSGNFWVLKAWDVPSILIEIGFLSSSKDLSAITSPSWRQKFIASLVRAINNYSQSTIE